LTGFAALTFTGGMLSFDKDLPSEEKDKRVDWFGAFLVTAGLVMIVFVLSDGSMAPNGWKTGYIIALLIVGVLLVVAYVAWEHFLERAHNAHNPAWWAPPPVMRVSLWRRARGKLAVTFLLAFLAYGSFMSFAYWIQLYYQYYVGYSPVRTMVRLLPLFVTGFIANVIIGLFVGHVPFVLIIASGAAMTAIGNLLFAVINPKAIYWAFGFPATIVSVFGADFTFASGTLFVAKVCLPHEQSVGGALFQTMTQIGSSFGLAISTIVYNSELQKASLNYGVVVNHDGTNAPLEAQLTGYRGAFWTAFAMSILGSILAAFFLRGVGVVGDKKSKDGAVTADEETGVRDKKAQHATTS